MPFSHIDFASMPWAAGGHPLEHKKLDPASGAVLLRFAPGFADPNWCTRSHVLYVLEGTLTVEFENTSLTVDTGQACGIDAGTRHRASNGTQSDVVVLAVSDLGPRSG